MTYVQEALIDRIPTASSSPPTWARTDGSDARLDVEQDWDGLAELVEDTWRMTAPKKLVAQFDSPA